jgi:hypothetical protein
MLRVNQGECREHRRCHFLLALSGREPAHVLLGGCLGDSMLPGVFGSQRATIRTPAVVLAAAIQKRAEPTAIRVPDLEFVASSLGQRWIGEKLSTELEEAFRKLRLRRGEGALRVGSRRCRSPRSTALQMSARSPCDRRLSGRCTACRRRCWRSRRRWWRRANSRDTCDRRLRATSCLLSCTEGNRQAERRGRNA